MTFPASVPLAVSLEVDPRNFLWARGLFGMAFAAELPVRRLAGAHRPGSYLMLLRRHVTANAGHIGMRRQHFCAGDIAMASPALRRHMRRRWVMGIVAGDAGLSRAMCYGNNLRKSRGPRRIVGVAQSAKTSFARSGRFVLRRILCVRARRPMTNFTGHSFVIRQRFLINDLIVAIGAGLLSRVLHFLRYVVINRCGAVVSVLPKSGRSEIPLRDDERRNNEDNGNQQPQDLIRNFFHLLPSVNISL